MPSSPKEYISPLGLGMDQSNPPVVGELERETSVVRRLDGDDIGAEVRSQEQAERLDGVGSFGLSSGETQLRELLVRLQHHHVRAKHHASLLLLVVIYLDSGVVRDSERDHLGLVTLDGSSGGTSWVGVGGEEGHYLQVPRWRGGLFLTAKARARARARARAFAGRSAFAHQAYKWDNMKYSTFLCLSVYQLCITSNLMKASVTG